MTDVIKKMKVGLSLEPELYHKIKLLACLKRMKINEYIASLLTPDVLKKAQTLVSRQK